MIKIREDIPKKISGITSLFLSFPFDQKAINIIKSLDKYAFDKKTYEWEVPVTSLSFLLDELTYVDDIDLTLQTIEEKTETVKPSLTYKTKPFPHQLETIEWFLNHDSGLLLSQPGLGKSASMIYLAQELKAKRGLEHCLVICGVNSLKTNWRKEIMTHSDLSCRIIGERVTRTGTVRAAPVKERAAELKNPLDAFFYILNIESLRSDDVVDAILKSKNKIDMIIVDEIHRCGFGAQQSTNLLKLKNFKYKIGLTGTLLTNNPLSSFEALKWIGVEKSTYTNFKYLYCEFGGFGNKVIVGYKNIDILKNEIESCSIRHTKDLLTLPPKNIIDETIEMDSCHADFYNAVKEGVKEECDKIELNSQNAMTLLLRLMQASVSPSILTTETIPASKLMRCCELVEDIVSQGDKVVIMSRFKEPINQLEAMLKQYSPLVMTGDVPDDVCSNNIDLFQKDPKFKVFLGTQSKAGTGITLNAARYLIMLDFPWTWAQYEQVTDRIHRITSKEPVFIYNLICENTVDELVYKVVQTKKALSDFVVDDKQTNDVLDILRQCIQDL